MKANKETSRCLTESEMLHKEWQGNIQGMQKAIEKTDIVVKDGFYYWNRDTHEHITGASRHSILMEETPGLCHKKTLAK